MKPVSLVIVGGVSAAIVAGLVALLWSFGASAVERERFTTLQIAPREVDFYMAVNTEPASSQWIAFSNVLSTLNVEEPVRDAWNELLAEQELTWDKDIVSLLGGEAYVAITDFSTLDDGSGLVAGFELRNAAKAEDLFLRLARQAADDEGIELLESEYEGETVYYVQEDFYGVDAFSDEFSDEFSQDGGTVQEEQRDYGALAFVGDIAILGMSREDVHGVIDIVEGRASSLADNAEFAQATSRQQEDYLLWGYADLSAAWDALEELTQETEESGGSTFDFHAQFDDLRADADSATFMVAARGNGFTIDATVLRAPGESPSQGFGFDTPFDSHYAEQVSEDTLAFVAGYDLYNEAYVPTIETLSELDLNFTDPYCGSLGGFAPFPGEYSEQDDPVYGQFYDEFGNFDDEAYFEWQTNIDRLFTSPDGTFNYDAYAEYFDGLYAGYCEENSQTVEEALAEFEQDAGFDLEDDLLSLMTGEFALAVNASNFDADEPDFDVLGMLDVTDAARVEESMRLLGEYIEREEGWTIDGDTADGIRRWRESPTSSDVIAWTVQDRTLAVSYPDGPAAQFLGGLDGPSLADSADWQEAMALLPPEKTFVAYVSLARILEELSEDEDAAQEFEESTNGEVTLDDLKPIRSLGIATSNVEGGWTLRIAVLIND